MTAGEALGAGVRRPGHDEGAERDAGAGGSEVPGLLGAVGADAVVGPAVVGRAAGRGWLGDEGGQVQVGQQAVDAVGIVDQGT